MLTQMPIWQELLAHFEVMKDVHMRDLFVGDADRAKNFSLDTCGLFFDYSKNRITEETLDKLVELALQRGLEEKRTALFEGGLLNNTECRPALHTALRNRSGKPVMVNGEDVMPEVKAMLSKMRAFAQAVFYGEHTGHTDKVFTDVVNIGIGGSFLGAAVVCDALKPAVKTGLNVHFISDVDGKEVIEKLKQLDSETTLFIVSSKTFTTQETMTNTETARQWVNQAQEDEDAWVSHFVAVTANVEQALAYGIRAENIFRLWDWVGGRYSLWSAIGLPIVLYAGIDQFESLLDGAYEMDCHFREAPLNKNMPVLMALLGVWYINFFNSEAQAVLPYDKHLERLPGHLQQLEMESNGKHTTCEGDEVDYHTAPVIWGQSGTNGQHAFYQLIHQGTQLIPADFIAPMRSPHKIGDHHMILLTHFFAQTEALMKGKTADEARAELEAKDLSSEQVAALLPHKTFEGNRPTNTIVFPELNAHRLGALMACYEHKVFVQGVIWDVNSFDQWGVELGKQLARKILPELLGGDIADDHDSSTRGLIDYYRRYVD